MTRVVQWTAVLAALALAVPVAARADDPPVEAGAETLEVVGHLQLPEYPTAEAVTTEAASQAGAVSVADALGLVPGVALSRVGSRNEAAVYVRGYDLRRMPLFLDGIPVYVPWDGVVDLDRFLLDGHAAVIVNKGFGSLLYGPNGVGGTINVVAQPPTQRLEGSVDAGLGSSGLDTLGLHVGTRRDTYYVHGDAGYLTQDALPLAGGSGERANSDRRDRRATVTFGFTPRPEDEYALTLGAQRGVKGQPVYAGRDPMVRLRFWRWPSWDKNNVYFRSSTALGNGYVMRGRAFFDTFANTLDSFDDATYTTQDRPSSTRSEFDDHSVGLGVEVGHGVSHCGSITAAVSFKNDIHRERTNQGPWTRYEGDIASVAVEGKCALSTTTTLTAGVSGDQQRTSEANGLPTPRASALNAVLGLFHDRQSGGQFHFTFARRTRLPTLRDRYSYRMGRSIPNPELLAEEALHLEAGYRGAETAQARFAVAAFYSRLDNAVEPVFLLPNQFQLQNVGTVDHHGIELRGSVALGSHVELGADASWLHRRRVAGSDRPLTELPEYRGGVSLVIRALPRLTFELSAKSEGSRDALSDAGSIFPLGGFTLLDARARLTLGKAWAVEANLANATDRVAERTEGYPEAGRRLFLRAVRSF